MKAIYLVGVVALLLLAACSQQQLTNNQLPPGPAANKVVTQVQEKHADKGDATKQALDAFLAKGTDVGFTVTYDTKDTFAQKTGTVVLYVQKNKTRTDITNIIEGDTIQTRQYQLADKIILCNKQGEWSCLFMDAVQPGNTPLDIQEQFEEPDVTVTKTSTRTIAGTTAECFLIDLSGPMGAISNEQCFSKEGVMLYSEQKMQQGTIKWEATSYSTSVTASDFEPPAKPLSMEDYYAQMAGGMPS